MHLVVNHRNGSKEDFADLLNERRLMSSNETAESDRDGRNADMRVSQRDLNAAARVAPRWLACSWNQCADRRPEGLFLSMLVSELR